MRVLALDLSTKTGFALLEKVSEAIVLVKSGSFNLEGGIESRGEYPKNFMIAAQEIADFCKQKVSEVCPDIIVIEETNLGSFSRYSQKALEFIHLAVLKLLNAADLDRVRYVSTSEWRNKTLKLSVANTKKIAKPFIKEYEALEAKIKSVPHKSPEKKMLEESRKEMKASLQNRCIFGKVDKKSISVAYANATYGKNLKKGQNDESDAICLGTAFLMGAKVCSNYTVFNHEKKEKK